MSAEVLTQWVNISPHHRSWGYHITRPIPPQPSRRTVLNGSNLPQSDNQQRSSGKDRSAERHFGQMKQVTAVSLQCWISRCCRNQLTGCCYYQRSKGPSLVFYYSIITAYNRHDAFTSTSSLQYSLFLISSKGKRRLLCTRHIKASQSFNQTMVTRETVVAVSNYFFLAIPLRVAKELFCDFTSDL